VTAEAQALIGLIETRYGSYTDEERDAVGGYLSGRIEPSREVLVQTFAAIREECPIRFGPPDEATVKKAILAYEDDTGIRLRRKAPSVERSTPEPEPLTPEEESELLAMAETAGIDTSREGWMQQFLFQKLGELAEAKKYKPTKAAL
jgi:hypothetical protein